MRRRSRIGRPLPALTAVALVPLLASACLGLGHSSAPTTTTTPQPPGLVAYVSLIGAGAAIGSGTGLQSVELGPSGSQPRRSVGVGTFPDAIAVSPDNKTLYVANYAANTVTPVSVATGRAKAPIAAGAGPAGIAISPDGATAYVTDAGTAPIGDTVTPINLRTDKAEAPITVGAGPQGIVISHDGRTAYVADAGAIVTGQSGSIGSTVTPIDLATRRAGAPITVGNGPISLALSVDGTMLFVANSGSGSISALSLPAGTVQASIGLTGSPQALVASSSALWVVDSSDTATGNNVTPIDLASLAAGTPVLTPAGPSAIALSPDGATAYVVCNRAGSLVALDVATRKLDAKRTTSIAEGPYALALASVPADELDRALGIVAAKKAGASK